ncbi:transcription elongation factor A protein-like 4 [Poecile atricapillus]|uniref:transcription elongation factor A protein-like 4 n=1 Tax=Poecile atricapillus TaxID=48891 RepID=UPI002738323A|nr:transcription elongation factor A protein-like 4 [Poecile atricapillus]
MALGEKVIKREKMSNKEQKLALEDEHSWGVGKDKKCMEESRGWVQNDWNVKAVERWGDKGQDRAWSKGRSERRDERQSRGWNERRGEPRGKEQPAHRGGRQGRSPRKRHGKQEVASQSKSDSDRDTSDKWLEPESSEEETL